MSAVSKENEKMKIDNYRVSPIRTAYSNEEKSKEPVLKDLEIRGLMVALSQAQKEVSAD